MRKLIAMALLALLLISCARVQGPDVYPPEVETPATDTPAPTQTLPGPINTGGSAISTRTPLATFTPEPSPSFGLWDPDATAYPFATGTGGGAISKASAQETVGPSSVSGSLGGSYIADAQGGSAGSSGGSNVADARGSLPSVQPVRIRGVWVATVLNIDFPTAIGDAAAQKRECIEILDNAKKWGFDTVFFQARPMGDALYKSNINPWSHFLTGSQGRDPGWDPLAFMVEEAHKRGLELHAWLNPYRVTHSSVDMSIQDLHPSSFAAQHPQWVLEYEGTKFLDPAVQEVRQHIADTVLEIIENYDVDGIHFDDYFYPSGYPLPQGAERDGIIDRERRENVTSMIRLVHDTIKRYNDRIIFGISPFGIWKNSASDANGSNTQGNESYYAQAADSLAWVREKIIDYLAPQIYWPIGFEIAEYQTLVSWWAGKLSGSGVSLLIGQGVYRDEVAGEITDELRYNARFPEITGSIFFSYQDMLKNPSLQQAIKSYYSE